MTARPPGRRDEPAGVLAVVKPPGMTSHDVVDACRRLFGLRRVGHAGTLDPAAAGVLVVCVGAATRLAEYLSGSDKRYRAELWLGIRTDSHDSEGRLEAVTPVPGLDEARLRQVMARFTGPQQQVPPAVSAVRQGGERAYRRHRRGEDVALAPRPVTIYDLRLVAWRPGPYPRVVVDVHCSKGTYIRALARDVGEALGCGATLAALVRTAQGTFSLDGAVTLEELERAAAAGRGRQLLLDPNRALSFLPAWPLEAGEARRVLHGGTPRPRREPWPGGPGAAGGTAGALPAGEAELPRVRLVDPAGRLLAVARLERAGDGWVARPEKVLGAAGGDGRP